MNGIYCTQWHARAVGTLSFCLLTTHGASKAIDRVSTQQRYAAYDTQQQCSIVMIPGTAVVQSTSRGGLRPVMRYETLYRARSRSEPRYRSKVFGHLFQNTPRVRADDRLAQMLGPESPECLSHCCLSMCRVMLQRASAAFVSQYQRTHTE